MNIYDKVTIEILKYVDKMNNDEEFKKVNPGITAQEFLCARVNPDITPKRLINILNGKAKRIKGKNIEISEYDYKYDESVSRVYVLVNKFNIIK